jgi:AcrR family transcriptional regulator
MPGPPYHHGDLRNSLVKEARAFVEAEGPTGLSLREIARRLGVSHAAPYRHFADREALLAAVMAEVFRDFARHLAEAAAAEATPEARFAARGRTYVRFAIAHPGVFALMFSREIEKSAYPELGAAARESYRGLEAGIAALVPAELVPAAALGAWSLVHGLANLVLDGQLIDKDAPPAEAERLYAGVGRIYAAGLKALAEKA